MTSGSSRPYTANSEYRPHTAWTDSEPPSTAHGPTSYAYPTQQFVHNGQHNHLYAQEEEEEEEEESEDEDVFAYLPPGTAQSDAAPHQASFNSHSQASHLQQQQGAAAAAAPSAAQLHNLVAAAGLDSSAPMPPSYSQTTPTNASFGHGVPVTTRATGTGSSYEPTDLGPNAYSMRPIPPSPGVPGAYAPGTGTNISFARSADSREVRVDLPSTGGSFSSSQVTPSLGGKRRVSSEPNTSVVDMATTLKYTDEAGGMDEPEEDSPYPEVRASVSNTDDPEMPALTIRMWFCGMLLNIIAIALNTFFNFRYPSPFLTPLVVLLVAYPFGKLLASTMPITTYYLPAFLGGSAFSLNPGPFNVKEHVLIFMMANIGTAPSYALNTLVVAELYYGLDFGIGFNFTLILSTQMTGLGLAGLARRFLVWPASMVWPYNLVSCTLLNTLHAGEDVDPRGGLTRYRFFLYVTGAAFAWTFLPGFLFQALSYFSWACWIAPRNLTVNQLFGTVSGLGMGIVTFDWAQISWIGSPLMIPWWAQVHIFAGFVLFYWILLPILYYTNTWFLGHLPMGGQASYDRFGQVYNISAIFNPQTHTFDVDAYNAYSALYLPGPYAMVYLMAFALSTCLIVHTILYHGKSLIDGIKRVRVEEDDIHAKLMKHYPEVPDSWYLSIGVGFFILGVVAIEVWPTKMPVYTLALSLLLPTLYMLPFGFIYAVTGQGLPINLLAEIIPAGIMPGQPLPNMIFKTVSVQTIGAALSFVQDLKLGHYMKVPPRASFLAQTLGGFVGALVQIGVKRWLFANVPDICQPTQKDRLVCPHNGVFFTASAIWGLIGPTRQFGNGALYHGHLYAMLVGALLPIPVWLWQLYRPATRLRYLNVPVMLNGPTFIPPARGINYTSWFVVGFIFQYVVRRRSFRWWSKFNYVLSAGLDSGTILSIIVIFLTLQLPFKNGGLELDWWGNTVFTKTLDAMPAASFPVAPGSYFDLAPNGSA